MSVVLTGGQAGDNPQMLPVLVGIRVHCGGADRPRTRTLAVVADKTYTHPSTRAAMRRRKVRFVTLKKADQARRQMTKGSRGGRPPAFDEELYRGRNVIERCVNLLKQFRNLATRYAKRDAYYRAEILLAATVLWLR